MKVWNESTLYQIESALPFYERYPDIIKKPFEIVLHVGRVTSLQSWVAESHVTVKPLQMNVLYLTTFPTLKACTSPYTQY